MRLPCIIIPLIAGCVAQPSATTQDERRQAYYARLQAQCQGYGFQPGTDAFADCVRREHLCAQDRGRERVQRGAAIAQESSRPGARAGESIARGTTQTPRPSCN